MLIFKKKNFSSENEGNSKKKKPLLGYEHCYAKTYKEKEIRLLGYTVFEHSCIVASIAKELIAKLPKNIHISIPKYAELAPLLHDIGKISPTFQKKLQPQLEKAEDIDITLENEWGGHSGISAITLEALLKARTPLSYIVGKHHERTCPQTYTANHESFGGQEWQEERIACVYSLIKEFYGTKNFPDFHIAKEIENYLLGLTIVSDWIGSGQNFEVPTKDWKKKISKAVEHLYFSKEKLETNLSFQDIFSFSPKPIQEAFYSSLNGSGLYILEAPMGLGKTEAALYAAYKMLEQSKANGIYFALPTQLTSEKIHERMNNFLEKILPNSKNTQNMLLHSKAWLKSYGINAFHEDESIDYSWFATKKKALLAPFGVGTIDQALLSVINVKHASVRTFGLAGKVVILDEVHSYDMYTGTLINELIQSLLNLGCIVIILSATLTQEKRISLFPLELSRSLKNTSYPLITSFSQISKECTEIGITLSDKKIVKIHKAHDTNFLIEKALDMADLGSQVLWIENTVDDAQKRYKEIVAFSQGMDIEVGLLHSRFTPTDREKIEDKWINLYGKNSQSRHEKGRILIGTQVLEQSIDIDADTLFTRFCPTDMLFQRLGRLHRHTDTKRPEHVKCEAYIIMPSDEEIKEKKIDAFEKSQYVYEPYILFRSLEIWKKCEKVVLPHDIRPFLEASYKEADETKNDNSLMLSLKAELDSKKEKLQKLALSNATQKVLAREDSRDSLVTTRINENLQKEVILLKKYKMDNNKLTVLTYSGENCRIHKDLSLDESKEVSMCLMTSTVKIPEYAFNTHNQQDFEMIHKLAGRSDACLIVHEDGSIEQSHDKYTLHYSSRLGLTITKKKECI